MSTTIIILIASFILIINSYASYKLFNSEDYEKQQKVYQFALIWLFPIIGTSLVVWLLKDDNKPSGINKRENKNHSINGSDIESIFND